MATRVEMPTPTLPPTRLSLDSPLFHEYMARYLTNIRVRQWLLCREPEGVRNADTFKSSMSYACLYYVPVKGAAKNLQSHAAQFPPFLDSGDFMMFHRSFDNFAVGSLYTTREFHALAQLRESMGVTGLSAIPKSRRFATDLAADALELIEFAWLEDDSLIVSCRRLSRPETAPPDRDDMLAIQGDILFYDIIPPDANPGVPRKRMTLFEQPVKCTFCGSRKFHLCQCPASFKRRAPPSSRCEHPSRKIYKLAADIVSRTSSPGERTSGVATQNFDNTYSLRPDNFSDPEQNVDAQRSPNQNGRSLEYGAHGSHVVQQIPDEKRRLPFSDDLHQVHDLVSPEHNVFGEASDVTHSMNPNAVRTNYEGLGKTQGMASKLYESSTQRAAHENCEAVASVRPTFSTCGSSMTGNETAPIDQTQDSSDSPYQIIDPHERLRVNQARKNKNLATVANFTSRLFSIDQVGSFFVRWYERVPNSKYMRLLYEPQMPFSYQFLCGTRDQTNILAARFINHMRFCQNAFISDTRFYGSITNGADINMLVSKENSENYVGEPLGGGTVLEEDYVRDDHVAYINDGTGNCQYALDNNQQSLSCFQRDSGTGLASAHSVESNLREQLLHRRSAERTRYQSNVMKEYTLNSEVQNRLENGNFSSGRNLSDVAAQSTLGGAQPSAYLMKDGAILSSSQVGSVANSNSAGIPLLPINRRRNGMQETNGQGVSLEAQPPSSVPNNFHDVDQVNLCISGIDESMERQIPSVWGSSARGCDAANEYLLDDQGYADDDSDEIDDGQDYDLLNNEGEDEQGLDAAVEAHIIDGEDGTPMCSACGATFKKTGNLTRHIQTVHLKWKPFRCNQCASRFGYKTHLNRHIQTVHNRANVVHCQECRREFRTQQQLDRHFQQAHSGASSSSGEAEQIKCNECGHAFSQRSNLNRHIQSIHQKLRHQCPACPSSFGQRFDLQRHVQRCADNGDVEHMEKLSAITQK